jgi:DNA-binding MarR family transcriptional regulator
VNPRLGFALRIAYDAVWRDFADRLAPYSVKPQHFAVLALLKSHPGSRLPFLAQNLRKQPSNLVSVIEELVSSGYLERRVEARDRRTHGIYITKEGNLFFKKLQAVDAAHRARIANVIGAAEIEVLVDMLIRLSRIDAAAEVLEPD